MNFFHKTVLFFKGWLPLSAHAMASTYPQQHPHQQSIPTSFSFYSVLNINVLRVRSLDVIDSGKARSQNKDAFDF